MITLSAETEVAVAPEIVWSALLDMEGWHEWAPFHPTPPARIAVGEKLKVSFPFRGRVRLSGAARLVRVDLERALWWRSGVPGLLLIEHGFELAPTTGGTRLYHAERFSGGLARIVLAALGPTQATVYERANEALRARLESGGGVRGELLT